VDDVLVSLKNPESGIPRLMDFLQMYGTLPGYTLNVNKTQALTFNFAPSFDQFNWDSTLLYFKTISD